MDDAGDVTQDCEQDVDEEVGAAATLQENAQRRENDGEDNLADITNERQNQLTRLVPGLKISSSRGTGGRARVKKLRKLRKLRAPRNPPASPFPP